jgi:hypothetical protein
LRIPSVRPPGPRAEKYATSGAGWNSLTSAVSKMTAVVFLSFYEIYYINFAEITKSETQHNQEIVNLNLLG